MTSSPRFVLPGSDRKELVPHGCSFPAVHPGEQAAITVRLTDAGIAKRFLIWDWLISNKLSPTQTKSDEQVIKATGSLQALEDTFGVKLHQRDTGDITYRAHFGPVSVPAPFEGLISGVFGLETRPVAAPRLKKSEWRAEVADNGVYWRGKGDLFPSAFNKPVGTFTPLEVAEAYNFPAGDGEGEVVAIIELGGGFRTNDLKAYWAYLGITGPTVTAVSVDGGRNAPGQDADAEVLLDIEVAGAIAPKATIAVFFAGNTSRGFIDAISQAVHDTHLSPSIISISWGGPESGWSQAEMNAMDEVFQAAAAKGITVLVASGDNGSSDGVSDDQNHVDFPASSGHVVACGGSQLVANGSTVTSEVVWNADGGAAGGGCSTQFSKPSYQTDTLCGNFRSVPDVAANASPDTGYVVRVDGSMTVVGGTSAVSPLLAGLTARLNQITGKRAGFLNPVLYSHESVCNDIVSGSNGSFAAGPGYDCASGLGSVDGTKLLGVLKS